ncbi:MAG: hypothetical protein GY786_11475 [Proteobacteria bacterium]|nr:hypothetical protein [Pseudomonadota bacterium]
MQNGIDKKNHRYHNIMKTLAPDRFFHKSGIKIIEHFLAVIMEESLLVFREKQHHFAILPHEFDRHISLDRVIVSPVKNCPSLWEFNYQQESLKGHFIQLGAMAGLKHTVLSHKGYLFLTDFGEKGCWGMFLNDIYLQTPIKKIEKKIQPIENQEKVPELFSHSLFHSLLRLGRQDIWIVNSVELFRHFHS